jgi:hypothetical protein
VGLVVFGFIATDVWVDIECFLMIAVDNAANSVLEIGSAVGLQGGLVEVVLVLGVSEGTGVGLEFFDVLFYFLTPLLFPARLLLKLTLPDASSKLLISLFIFRFLVGIVGIAGRTRAGLGIGSTSSSRGGLLLDRGRLIGFGLVRGRVVAVSLIKGNVSFLLGCSVLLDPIDFSRHFLVYVVVMIDDLRAIIAPPREDAAHAGRAVAEMVEMLAEGAAFVLGGRIGLSGVRHCNK